MMVSHWRNKTRRGAITVLAAFCLVAIFAFAAFSLDIGYITIVRQELLSAVDASALAAAQELGSAPDDGLAQVKAAAVQVALANRVAGQPLVLDPRTDIEVGAWNPDTNEFTALDGADLSLCNSVRINGELAASRNTGVNLFFAPVINTRSIDMRESAVSIYGSGEPRDVIVVIDCSGSMAQNNRMTYTIPAAQALVDELGDDDRLGLAVYSYPAPVNNGNGNGNGNGQGGNGGGRGGNGGGRGGNGGGGRGGNGGGGRGGGRSSALPGQTVLASILPQTDQPTMQIRSRNNNSGNRNQNNGRNQNNAGGNNRNGNGMLGGAVGGGLGNQNRGVGQNNANGGNQRGQGNNNGNRNGAGNQNGGRGNQGGNQGRGNGGRGNNGNNNQGGNGRGNNGNNNQGGNGRGGNGNGGGNGGGNQTYLTGYLERPLNHNFNPVRLRIPQLRPNLYASTTNIAGGLRVAIEELIPKKRTLANGTEVEQIIVLMTDGHANETEPPGTNPVNSIYHFVNVADQNDIIIHGITLGRDADQTSVRDAAEQTGGEYHYVPDGDLVTLFEVYRGIGRGTGSRLVR